MRSYRLSLPLSLALCGLGCLATRRADQGPPARPVAEFPAPAALAALTSKPVVLPPLNTADVPEDGWTVDAAQIAPAPAEPWAPQGIWDDAFARTFAQSGRKARLTRAMACVAREVGRFYLAHEAPPPESLRRFIGAACGVFAPTVGFESLTGTVPDRAADAELLSHWGKDLGSGLLGRLPAGAREVGFWFGRHAGHALALVTFQSSPVELKPFSLVPDKQGEVLIEGRLDGEATHFAGWANQGRFGVKACRVDPGTVRPAFRVWCPVAPEDETAWLEIAYVPPRAVLALPIVQALARHDATKALTFKETSYASARPVANAAEFTAAVLAALNASRAQAGLGPVRLAGPQSAIAEGVARQYFAAALGDERVQDMNVIALGLLAGWQVSGTIRDGSFFSAMVPHTRDAGRWLSSALSLPLGREALLDRNVDEVALGPAFFESPDGLGAIVAGYRFQHGNDHRADVELLWRRISAARQQKNLPPPTRMSDMAGIFERELARVQLGLQTPYAALRETLQSASGHFSVETRGFVIEATSVEALDVPPELLRYHNLSLDIGVSHYKPPGAAWAQLIVIIVYIDPLTIQG